MGISDDILFIVFQFLIRLQIVHCVRKQLIWPAGRSSRHLYQNDSGTTAATCRALRKPGCRCGIKPSPKEIETMFQTKRKATFTLFLYLLALAAPAMLGHAAPAPKAPVVAAADFSLSVTPAFVARKRGTGFTWDISVTALNGFNGT